MDVSGLKEKFLPFAKQYFLPLILGFLGLIFLVYGMIGYFGQKKDKPDILFDAASTSASDTTDAANDDSSIAGTESLSAQQKMIAVDVEGAVQNPGVYKLPSDSRMQDALISAGGLGKDADRDRIARSVNLAAKLTDGSKIYIAAMGESTSQSTQGQSSVLSSQSDGLININSATESELDALPGIGKTTADKIINNRPFNKIEDLLDKKIVGKKVFTDIENKIVAQ